MLTAVSFRSQSLRALLLITLIIGFVNFAPTAESLEITRDICYGSGYITSEAPDQPPTLYALHGDLYHPKSQSDAPLPAIIMIHGGSFKNGDKNNKKLTRLAHTLAQNGYACFLTNYRLIGQEPPAPSPWNLTLFQAAVHAAYVDAKTAIRFLRAHAKTYNIDPNRIAILGESAGAFAALAAGISDPEDFLSDSPELPIPPNNNPQTNARPDAIIDLWGSAQPILQKFDPSDPPILIIHGTDDTNIGTDYRFALNIKAACEENHIPYTFCPFKGRGHGAWSGEHDGKDIATLVLEFLNPGGPAYTLATTIAQTNTP